MKIAWTVCAHACITCDPCKNSKNRFQKWQQLLTRAFSFTVIWLCSGVFKTNESSTVFLYRFVLLFFFLSNILSEPKLGGRIQIQVIDVRHEIDQIDGGHTIFSCLMHILYISRIPFLILQPWNTRIRICIYIYRQNILLQEPTSHTHYTPNTPTHTELRVVFL